MTNLLKKTVVPFAFMFLFIVTLTTVNAANGNWGSTMQYDLNGASEVGTTYTGGGNPSETVKLDIVYELNLQLIGTKTVGCAIDQKVSHTAWGTPFQFRRGNVYIRSVAYHNPYFNS